jgi:hypothetical protein
MSAGVLSRNAKLTALEMPLSWQASLATRFRERHPTNWSLRYA